MPRKIQTHYMRVIVGNILFFIPVLLTLFFDIHHVFHEMVIMTHALAIVLFIVLINRRVVLFATSLMVFHIVYDTIIEQKLSIQPILSSFVLLLIVMAFMHSNRNQNRLVMDKENLLNNLSVALTEHELVYDDQGVPVDYTFIYANHAFERLTRRKREDFINQTFFSVMPAEDKRKLDILASVVLEQKTITFESYNQTLNKYFHVTSYPSAKGRFISIYSDITEAKNVELILKQDSERLNHVLDSAQDFIVELGLDQRLVRFYGQGIASLGFENPNEMIGKTLSEIFGFVDSSITNQLNQAYMGNKTIVNWFYHVNHQDIVFESTFAPIHFNDRIEGVVIITRNITEKTQQTKKLEESHQKLQNIIEATQAATWEFDLRTGLFEINHHYAHQLGYHLEELLPFTQAKFFNLVHPDDHPVVKENMEKMVSGDFIHCESSYRIRHKDGHPLWMMGKARVSLIVDHQPVLISGMSIDITQRMRYEERLEFYSHHDALTGLKNRRYYSTRIMELDHPQYYPLGILMMDLNGLKLLNDAYGHDMGDLALMEVAQSINEHLRQDDVACRIGGDEFVLIMPNTEKADIEAIKQRIIGSCEKKKIKHIQISVSAGFAIKTKEEESMHEVVKRAENNMYKIKIYEGKSARGKAIHTILKTLNDKYREEEVHSIRVSRLCKQMGIALNMPEYQIKELELAGLVHDIGKISIPDHILKKNGKLTDEEYSVIKTHSDNGYQILRSADEYSSLADSALYHHERWDGKGYPHGLKGENIPYYARIIGICDAYEAMTSDRSYRKAPGKDYAIDQLIKHKGTQFDPTLTEVFVNLVVSKEEIQ